MKKIFFCLCFLFGCVLLSSVAHAAAPEFFKGKTIRLVVGNSVGGAQDDWVSLCSAVPGQTHSRKSRYRGAKHAGRRDRDCGQLRL